MRKTSLFLSIIALAASAVDAGAQKYVITGTAPASATKVYLYNLEKEAPDSATVSGGKFTFTGEAEGKIFAYASAKPGEGTPVILDGNITMDMTTDKTGGTPENEGLSKWSAAFNEKAKALQALMTEYRALQQSGKEVPAAEENRISKAYDSVMVGMIQVVKECCTANPTAKFPAYFLRNVASQMDKEDVIAIANAQPAFMQVSLLQRLRGALEGWKRQAKGVMFTDIAMADTAGVTRKLSDFVGKGKYVLIDFWASWCGPCRQEMPHVKAVYEKYHAKGFDIVGLSFDNNKKAWTAGIKKLGLPWHQLSDLKGWGSIAAQTYGINAIPATLLVGPDGKIIANGLRGEELDAKLAEIFK